MNKLLASVAAAAILVSSAAFAGPDTGTSASTETAAPAAMEAAPAKADTAPVAKKHSGKKHTGKKHTGHKKAKKDDTAATK